MSWKSVGQCFVAFILGFLACRAVVGDCDGRQSHPFSPAVVEVSHQDGMSRNITLRVFRRVEGDRRDEISPPPGGKGEPWRIDFDGSRVTLFCVRE